MSRVTYRLYLFFYTMRELGVIVKRTINLWLKNTLEIGDCFSIDMIKVGDYILRS